AQHPAVGYVAPEEVAPVAEPDGSLGPSSPRVEAPDRGATEPNGIEARGECFDTGVGIVARPAAPSARQVGAGAARQVAHVEALPPGVWTSGSSTCRRPASSTSMIRSTS